MARGVEGVEAQKVATLMVLGVGGGHPLPGRLSHLSVGVDQVIEHGAQGAARAQVGDTAAVAVESVAAQSHDPGADDDVVGGEAEDEGGRSASVGVALPPDRVDPRVVGRLVLGEAEVAVDAEQRLADCGLGLDVGGDACAQAVGDLVHEEADGAGQVTLVGAALRVEERSGVVGGEPGEERDALGREPTEALSH